MQPNIIANRGLGLPRGRAHIRSDHDPDDERTWSFPPGHTMPPSCLGAPTIGAGPGEWVAIGPTATARRGILPPS